VRQQKLWVTMVSYPLLLVYACTPGDPPPPPRTIVVVAAGDIATGGPQDSRTARLIRVLDPDRVLTLGDNAYPNGTLQEFRRYYEPTWGSFKGRSSPALGNHEYNTPGAAGYFAYFGGRAPAANYAFVLGGWRLLSLDSEHKKREALDILRDTLTSDRHRCELVYFHRPRWSSAGSGSDPDVDALWREAVSQGVDVVLSGHHHIYERFAPMGSDGDPDASGTRQFIVGTGGAPLADFGSPISGSEVRIRAWGVLRLSLRSDSYSWDFRDPSNEELDSGESNCHA
jgi:acid phosphatase type 7